MDLKLETKKYYNDVINTLQKWINIDSVFDEKTISKEKPFGEGPYNAMRYIGELAKKDGFKVDYCDGYCVEISCGTGPYVGVFAHCDVVPVTGEWKYPPFSGHIEDDIMYGRGTSDDKGPAVASYYALKMLRDLNLINNYSIKLIIGGNEETGSKCLHHYFKEMKKEDPVYGFTPDGDFPLIYGEKAISGYKVTLDISINEIEYIKSGVALNSVIDRTECRFKIDIDEKSLKSYCLENNLKYEINGKDLVLLGKSAHGSLPSLGINSSLHLLKYLALNYGYDVLLTTADGYMDGTCKKFGVYNESKLLHDTTFNVGILNYKSNKLEYFVNFRYPENVSGEETCKKLNDLGLGKVDFFGEGEYLLMDPESDMIKTLMKCYQDVTGDLTSKPMAIGGGTYAKECKNTVAFGSHFPGREDHIHEANEKIHLEDLLKSIEIYALAMMRLGELIK